MNDIEVNSNNGKDIPMNFRYIQINFESQIPKLLIKYILEHL